MEKKTTKDKRLADIPMSNVTKFLKMMKAVGNMKKLVEKQKSSKTK